MNLIQELTNAYLNKDFVKTGAQITETIFKLKPHILEKLFLQVLEVEDGYNLSLDIWPNWLTHKYATQLEQLLKGID